MIEPLVKICNLSIKYIDNKEEKLILDNISVDIASSKVTSLVGESGSGKTLTALSILKLLPSKKMTVTGSIIYQNQDLLSLDEKAIIKLRGKDFGVIFQDPMMSLNSLHTIYEQITESITIHNPSLTKAQLKERVVMLLEAVELGAFGAEKLNSYPFQLSGGQRQRVMIAIAIANNPKLLIADEPTTALDPINGEKIMDLIKKIRDKHSMSVLFITHDLPKVKKISDYIYVVKNGNLIEHGKTQEIFTNPKQKYTKYLLSSSPYRLACIPSEESILEVKELSVVYPGKIGLYSFFNKDNNILKQLTFTLNRGATLGVIGESGSGKTSLIMAIMRLIKASGSIIYQGKNILKLGKKELKQIRREIQIIFQDPYSSLNPRMTIKDIVAEGLSAHNLVDNLDDKVAKVLNDVGLPNDLANGYVNALSGGQRQRVAIARALIMEPKIILLDEPTSALDKPVQLAILKLLAKLQHEKQLSYILVSHDIEVVNSMSNKIMVLNRGEIVQYYDVSNNES